MIAYFFQGETIVLRSYLFAPLPNSYDLWFDVVKSLYFSKTKELELAPSFLRIDFISSTKESGPQI